MYYRIIDLSIYLVLLTWLVATDLVHKSRDLANAASLNSPKPCGTTPTRKNNVPRSMFSAACLLIGLITFVWDLVEWKSAVNVTEYMAKVSGHILLFEILFGIPAVICSAGAFIRHERFRWATMYTLAGFLGGLL